MTEYDSYRRLDDIRKRINEIATLIIIEPKNQAKRQWTDAIEDQALYEILRKKLDEEVEEFSKLPSYHEAGDVLNVMAMLIDVVTERIGAYQRGQKVKE